LSFFELLAFRILKFIYIGTNSESSRGTTPVAKTDGSAANRILCGSRRIEFLDTTGLPGDREATIVFLHLLLKGSNNQIYSF